MRWVGALMVVVAAALLGHAAAARRERRVRELDSLLHGLGLLETEVVYGLTMLPDALERAGRGAPYCRALFETAAGELSRGAGAAKAWLAGIEELLRKSALERDDVLPAVYLAGALGLSSAEDQSRHLELARRQLEARLAAERERLPQAARVARALGLCGGLAAALFFI